MIAIGHAHETVFDFSATLLTTATCHSLRRHTELFKALGSCSLSLSIEVGKESLSEGLSIAAKPALVTLGPVQDVPLSLIALAFDDLGALQFQNGLLNLVLVARVRSHRCLLKVVERVLLMHLEKSVAFESPRALE